MVWRPGASGWANGVLPSTWPSTEIWMPAGLVWTTSQPCCSGVTYHQAVANATPSRRATSSDAASVRAQLMRNERRGAVVGPGGTARDSASGAASVCCGARCIQVSDCGLNGRTDADGSAPARRVDVAEAALGGGV